MTWPFSCPNLRCIALPLLGILISANVCQAQKFVMTAPAPEIGPFIGIADEATFDNEDFMVAKFLGIPFAQSERFSKPEFQKPDQYVFEATEYKAICYQRRNKNDICQKGFVMSEDCLYLNVFVPTSFTKLDFISTPPPPSSEPKPIFAGAIRLSASKLAVYIYIHGRSFMDGSSNCYDSSKLAGLGNVIVVTISYRLGALGFLYTKDGAIPGNLALWDQHTAIKWVKTYIHLFGGDPDRITVGGHSAGSYSSILQALYQPNDHLFHRVIAQSGTPTARGSVSRFGEEITLEVAKILKCSLSSKPKGAEMKSCLMNVGAQELAEVLPKIITPSGLPIQPIIDGEFVKEDPAEVLSCKVTFGSSDKPEVPAHFTRKDLLTGISASDGLMFYILHMFLLAGFDQIKAMSNLKTPIDPEGFRTLTKEHFQDKFTDDVDEILIDAVVDQYTDWKHPNDNVSFTNRAIDMLTDLLFAIPSLDTASSHVVSGDAKTFVYRFNLPMPSSVGSAMPWFEGTNRGAEVPYVFGDVFQIGGVTTEDKLMARYLMTFWANFVKTGDPNKDEASSGDTHLSLPIWEEYDETDQSYLEIAFSPSPVSKKRLVAYNRHFWSVFMPRLRHRLKEAEAKQSKSNSGTNIQTDYLIVISLVVFLWKMF